MNKTKSTAKPVEKIVAQVAAAADAEQEKEQQAPTPAAAPTEATETPNGAQAPDENKETTTEPAPTTPDGANLDNPEEVEAYLQKHLKLGPKADLTIDKKAPAAKTAKADAGYSFAKQAANDIEARKTNDRERAEDLRTAARALGNAARRDAEEARSFIGAWASGFTTNRNQSPPTPEEMILSMEAFIKDFNAQLAKEDALTGEARAELERTNRAGLSASLFNFSAKIHPENVMPLYESVSGNRAHVIVPKALQIGAEALCLALSNTDSRKMDETLQKTRQGVEIKKIFDDPANFGGQTDEFKGEDEQFIIKGVMKLVATDQAGIIPEVYRLTDKAAARAIEGNWTAAADIYQILTGRKSYTREHKGEKKTIWIRGIEPRIVNLLLQSRVYYYHAVVVREAAAAARKRAEKITYSQVDAQIANEQEKARQRQKEQTETPMPQVADQSRLATDEENRKKTRLYQLRLECFRVQSQAQDGKPENYDTRRLDAIINEAAGLAPGAKELFDRTKITDTTNPDYLTPEEYKEKARAAGKAALKMRPDSYEMLNGDAEASAATATDQQ